MKKFFPASLLVSASLLLYCSSVQKSTPASDKNYSQWVRPGADGKWIYKTTPDGDRIMDFSHAGYMGGGIALPSVPVVKTVEPSGGKDDAGLIQKAIDEVSALPMKNGFRGAVLLAPGIFPCSKTISIQTSGVVLRGSGSGSNGTTIQMAGERHCAIVIGGRRTGQTNSDDDSEPAPGSEQATKAATPPVQTTIRDLYVPSGSNAFTVADINGFSAGDTIVIKRPTTAAWVKFMGMDDMKRDGRLQTYISLTRTGNVERRIRAVDGNQITVEVPLSDSYDARVLNPPGTLVVKSNLSAPVSQVGIEKIRIQCPPLEITYGRAPYSAVRVGGDDCWVKDVYCEETMNSTAITGRRVTLQQVIVKHTYPNLGASKPSDFSIEGCQILLDRCRASGGNTYFVWTGSLQAGPNVVLNCSFNGHGSRLQPHQRWATGLLIDNCKVPDGGIDYANRGVAGSGHGWTMGWAVAWNCLAKTFIIQKPPGSMNWAIGCIGARKKTARYFDTAPILPEGEFDSYGQNVAPQSLYLAQLEERLGPQALKNIGYASNDAESFRDKTLKKLPELKYDVDPVLGRDLGMHRPVNPSNERKNAREFGAENALDGNPKTYWAIDDGLNKATFEVDMEGPVIVDAVEICEAAGFEGRILEYQVDGLVDSDYQLLSKGTTVGKRKIDRFPKETVWKVRLTIFKTTDYPAIQKFGIYGKEEY